MKALRGCLTAATALVLFLGLQMLIVCIMIYGAIVGFGADYAVVTQEYVWNKIVEMISMPATLLSDLGFVAILLAVAVLLDKDKDPRRYLALNKMSLYTVPTMIAFGITASVLIGVVWQLLPFPQSMWDYYNSLVTPLAVNDPLTVVTAVVIVPIAEELLCRSVLIREFRRFMHPVLAVFVSAALFGIIHGNVIQGTYAFACGVLMGFIYLRYRSVVASILFHAGFNASNYVTALIPEEAPILYALIMYALLGCAILLGFCAFFFNGKRAKENVI